MISELAGGSNVRAKLANRYADLEDPARTKAILEEIQDKEHAGYSFEKADGSFDLIVRRHLGSFSRCSSPSFIASIRRVMKMRLIKMTLILLEQLRRRSSYALEIRLS